MTDIILLILSSILGFIVGTFTERRIRLRERLYYDMFAFVKSMRVNVEYEQLTVDDFLSKFSLENVTSADFILLSGLENRDKKTACKLTSDERKEIIVFFDGLQKGNKENCVNHLAYYETIFKEKLKLAQDDCKTKGAVCRKVGLLLGVTIGLMLI